MKTFLVSGLLILFSAFASAESASNSPTILPSKVSAKPTIIGLAPNVVEIIYALGAGPQLLGASEHSTYPEDAQRLPQVSNYLNIDIEAIVTMNPDIVVVWKGGTPEKGIQKLIDLNIKVFQFSANNFSEMLMEIKRLGQEIGRNQAAKELTIALQQKYDAIKLQFNRRNSLIAFVEVWPNPLTTATQGTIVDQAIQVCGVKNLFQTPINSYPQVSLESVITQPMDVIIQPVSKTAPAQLMDWSNYTHLNAVNNGAIISPDSDKLLRWSPRWIDEVQLLCQSIARVASK